MERFIIEAVKMKKIEPDEYLCRFVADSKGNIIGESVAMDGDVVIIKVGKNFIGIPVKHIEDDGKVLKIKGLFNFDKAEELGKKWAERYEKGRV